MASEEPENKRALCFNDGYVLDAEHVFLASQVRAFAHVDGSRISVIVNGDWKYADFEQDAIVSVACRQSDGTAVFLGYNGKILVGGGRRPVVETINDVETYGNMLRVQNIGDEIYACGMSGQVYHRTDEGWQHIDRGILGSTDVNFEDLSGTGHENMFAVGSFGSVYRFDGVEWKDTSFPTNVPLAGVKCTKDGEVFVCGDRGAFYRGDGDSWEFIGDPDVDHNFWALEEFEGNIYLAYESGLLMHDGTEFSEVEITSEREIDCHRLHANDGVLWSFGVDDLFYYDGLEWNEAVCPLNRT